MASIFKQQYTTKVKDPKTGKEIRVKKKSAAWYIDYKDGDGIRKRVKAFKDKTATLQLAAQLEKEAELAECGIVDKYKAHRKRPLSEHLVEFKQALLDNGTTAKHAGTTYQRVRDVITNCRFVTIGDVQPSTVLNEINKMYREVTEKVPVTGQGRKKYEKRKVRIPLSIKSRNYYLKAAKQFFNWMKDDQRTEANPIDHLKCQNADTDIKKKRRALLDGELSLLINTTLNSGEEYRGMCGHERAMLYLLAVNTGFRANELASLCWRSFDFDEKAPTVTVTAGNTKKRREAVQPIRIDTAKLFKAWQVQRGDTAAEKVFHVPMHVRWADMMKADLIKAGIEYQDDSGRDVDFHALRHTYITNVVKGGASPKIAQALARHSKITLTMDTYGHLFPGQAAEAVGRFGGMLT